MWYWLAYLAISSMIPSDKNIIINKLGSWSVLSALMKYLLSPAKHWWSWSGYFNQLKFYWLRRKVWEARVDWLEHGGHEQSNFSSQLSIFVVGNIKFSLLLCRVCWCEELAGVTDYSFQIIFNLRSSSNCSPLHLHHNQWKKKIHHILPILYKRDILKCWLYFWCWTIKFDSC